MAKELIINEGWNQGDTANPYESGNLITNEYAVYNPTAPDRVTDPDWTVTSGSLFGREGYATNYPVSGVIDTTAPNALSTNGNNSKVFRMISSWTGSEETMQRIIITNWGTVSGDPSPNESGIKVFTRYVAEDNLYYVAVNRADNKAVIKKKVPGGPSNGGTYHVLGGYVDFPVTSVQRMFYIRTITNPDGSVTISLATLDGGVILVATDVNAGGTPPLLSGKFGIRSDYCKWRMDKYTVHKVV